MLIISHLHLCMVSFHQDHFKCIPDVFCAFSATCEYRICAEIMRTHQHQIHNVISSLFLSRCLHFLYAIFSVFPSQCTCLPMTNPAFVRVGRSGNRNHGTNHTTSTLLQKRVGTWTYIKPQPTPTAQANLSPLPLHQSHAAGIIRRTLAMAILWRASSARPHHRMYFYPHLRSDQLNHY